MAATHCMPKADLQTYVARIGPEQSIAQVALLALFNRQRFAGTNLTLSHLFDDPTML
jgi:hypothetical protein